MNIKKKSKIIILGSGPAGYTAAIYAARANVNPILITGSEQGGQLTTSYEIENWPGEIKSITGSALMEKFYLHTIKFRTTIINDHIYKVNLKSDPFFLEGENFIYSADSLIIATGSSSRYLGLQSETLYKGKGVSTCAVCDGFFFKNQIVSVVGGGNSALEEAIYLSKITSIVYLIHRKNYFRAEKILIDRVLNAVKEKKIKLYLNTVVEEIIGNKQTVTGINIKNLKNEKQEHIKLSGVFIAIGHTPNSKIFNNQLKMKNGYIKVKSGLHGNVTETSTPGVFAAGDVTDHIYKQAITASASGCMAALDAVHYLENKLNN